MSQQTKRLARAVRNAARRTVDVQGQKLQYALCRSVSPFTAEIIESGLFLDQEDLVFGQWSRKYNVLHGIEVGDTFMVTAMPNGDFVVLDVVSETSVS